MKEPNHVNGPRFTIMAGASVIITPNHRPQSAYAHEITRATHFNSMDDQEAEHMVFRTEGWTIRVHEKHVVIRPVVESLSFNLELGQPVIASIDKDGNSDGIVPYHEGPAEVGKTILDVCAGDQLWVRGQVCRVAAVFVHRSSPPADESAPVDSGRAFLQAVAERS